MRQECVMLARCSRARHMASGTETSQLPRLPYGEQDDDASARHMASVTILSRLRSRPSFWLSSGDLYGWENYSWPSFHFIIFSRKSSFDNTFSDLYKALNMVFWFLFLEEIFLRNFSALISPWPILTPTTGALNKTTAKSSKRRHFCYKLNKKLGLQNFF